MGSEDLDSWRKSDASKVTKKTVLAVDDDSSQRRWYEGVGRGKFWRMLTAESAEKAMAAMREQSIDVLLVDEKMPVVSGTKLLEWVQENYSFVTRIVVSGASTYSTAARASALGVWRFVEKPIAPKELEEVILDAFQKRDEEIQKNYLYSEVGQVAHLIARTNSFRESGAPLLNREMLANLVDGRAPRARSVLKVTELSQLEEPELDALDRFFRSVAEAKEYPRLQSENPNEQIGKLGRVRMVLGVSSDEEVIELLLRRVQAYGLDRQVG